MSGWRWAGMMTLLLVGAGSSPPALSAGSVPAPLFASDEEVELTLELPLRRLLRQRQSRPVVEGTVVVTGTAALDVEVAPRGHHRLDFCRFPPLLLNFRRSEVTDTLFAGQDRLKLVTLCRDTESYTAYLALEYFVYRMYGILSDAA
ncbi:MAG: hypothetical protein EHM50_10140, partial [Lysobacterales bacterium]